MAEKADTETKKRYRHKRPPEAALPPLNFNRSPRYARILWHTYLHRYVSSTQLAALLHIDEISDIIKSKRYAGKNEPSLLISQVQRSIVKLWQHGFLEKRVTYVTTPSGSGAEPDVYILSDLGAAYVSQYLVGVFLDQLNIPKMPRKDKPHKGMPQNDAARLLHQVMTTDILVAAQLASALQPEYKIIHFCHDRVIQYNYLIESERLGVNPDGFIILEHVPTRKRLNIFLEIDRSTETSLRWKSKMMGYFRMPQSRKGIYDFLLNYYREVVCPEESGVRAGWIKNFIVLTVTQSKQRQDYILPVTQNSFSNGHGSPLFWFCESSEFNFIEKQQKISQKKTTYTQAILSPHLASQFIHKECLRVADKKGEGKRFSLEGIFQYVL
ncbi:hypothetical protein COW36_03495 [bacterium (Candidatus Blackallbacteria) CG17_big_fil_post_rev_8_21_14_2_50_48_46]|uniref:Uncharacterized protein n=1 Tax=bacterium (Candidatus Blackallbacteria) CG17_big_fil_post_rev_8_21_14_2_50_48_46 TaxID=2014261 RepID=A0A2M7G9I1_9BACT|nr:MAG: hypothetical protein COW64_25915 [bacterium (Candidatus Blackallbacteria) CG18_big_fil_WC_8_21_14_2_50_49_26]PIW18775.1 MAG: hypothetical protein COW36_03495 [bacterium (Candidatus Blackallbacteria) CG17_big_fil_post_rev_8_21_14_2_50_48_46]